MSTFTIIQIPNNKLWYELQHYIIIDVTFDTRATKRHRKLDNTSLEDLHGRDLNETCRLHHANESIDEEEQHGDYEEMIVPHGMVDPEEGVEEVQVVHGEESVVETAPEDVEGCDPYNDRQYPRD